MDCERFDQHVIDELYDELDELTHAALERHVAGCSRCAGVLAGLRATRAVAVLPLIEPPDDLEARILARFDAGQSAGGPAPAVAAAPPNAPQGGGVLRFLRWAGRPQFAMAAAFLLLIGASVFLTQSASKRAEPAAAAVARESPPAAAPAATAAPTATVARGLGEGAAEAKVAQAEPQASAAPAATAEDGGPPAQVMAAARARAPAARPAAGPPNAALLASDLDKPADQPSVAAAGATAGAKASKKLDEGGMNPRAPAAPAPRKPIKAVGFAL